MRHLLSLPLEIIGMIYKECLPNHENLKSESHFEIQAALLARKLLPQVCRQFAAIDQKYILNSYKEIGFTHTCAALNHLARLNYPEKKSTPII